MSDYFVAALPLADGTYMRVAESDLVGARGVRCFPNRVFDEAKEASARAIQERIDRNAGRVAAPVVEVAESESESDREWYR